MLRSLRLVMTGSLFMLLADQILRYLRSSPKKWDMRKCLKLLRLTVIPRKLLILPVILFRKIQNRSGNVYYLRKNITDPVIIYTYDSTAKGRKGDRRSGSIMQLHMP